MLSLSSGSARRRTTRGALAFGAAIALSSLLPGTTHTAHAAIGGCAGDPVVVLSNGATVDLGVVADASASDVQQIVYDLHAPAGTTIVGVISLGPLETLHFYADNGPTTYDTVTRVMAPASHSAVTATASVAAPLSALSGPTATASATGTDNQNLPLHLSV